MAGQAGPSREKCDTDNETDEKLNLYSDKFDPLTFLLSDKAIVPKPTGKVFDNIAMWYSHYTRGGSSAGRGKKPEQKDVTKRKWLPHQCKDYIPVNVYFCSLFNCLMQANIGESVKVGLWYFVYYFIV